MTTNRQQTSNSVHDRLSSHRTIVRYTTMSESMQRTAIDVAIVAVDKCITHADIAMHIQNEFSKKYNFCHWWEFGRHRHRSSCWQCIVGRDIGSYALRPAGHYIKVDIDQLTVILFKNR